MAEKNREKVALVEKLVDYGTARFAEGDFETVRKVLTAIISEKVQSAKFKFLRAKFAIHEGKNPEFRNSTFFIHFTAVIR